jgi:uncharacterized protein YbcI
MHRLDNAAAVPARRRAPDPMHQISGEIAAAIRRGWGRGPNKATAHWAGPNTLLVLLVDEHTAAERTLSADDRTEEVLHGRRLLRSALAGEFKEIVERAIGRRVITAIGGTRVDPNMSAEVFVLEERAHPNVGGP